MAVFRLSRVTVAGCALALAACTGGPPDPRVPPPGSQTYQLGYVQGCPSGYVDAGRDGYEAGYYAKDQQLYASNAEYRQGWDQGHSACYEDERRYPRIGGPKEGGIKSP